MTLMALSFAVGILPGDEGFFVCAKIPETPKTNGSTSSSDIERNIESSY
jgi:hypothetical protein